MSECNWEREVIGSESDGNEVIPKKVRSNILVLRNQMFCLTEKRNRQTVSAMSVFDSVEIEMIPFLKKRERDWMESLNGNSPEKEEKVQRQERPLRGKIWLRGPNP